MATAPNASNDKITSGIVIILILLGFTVIAGFNDKLGKIMMTIMGGIAFLWFLTSGAPLIKNWFGKVGQPSIPSNAPQPQFPVGGGPVKVV